MKLNARQIDTAKPKEKAYKLADGGGLYLLVKPGGGEYWRLKYRVAGKEKLLALGVYPEVTLADAPAKLEEAKRGISGGIDLMEGAIGYRKFSVLKGKRLFAILRLADG
ncbi:integrase arm-type DNA-binding domain-containing protein, partial [Escherichia coli]|nr:integrase arm-type DNA-binding domain-containing protein [Escherichia coli]